MSNQFELKMRTRIMSWSAGDIYRTTLIRREKSIAIGRKDLELQKDTRQPSSRFSGQVC